MARQPQRPGWELGTRAVQVDSAQREGRVEERNRMTDIIQGWSRGVLNKDRCQGHGRAAVIIRESKKRWVMGGDGGMVFVGRGVLPARNA